MLLCPNCLATPKSLAKLSPRNAVRRLLSHGSCHRVVPARGFVGPSITSPPSKNFEEFPPQRVEPLTVLHKATKLLPRVPGYDEGPGFSQTIKTSHLWDSILTAAYEDLSATTERPVKVVVCGLDEWSGARDLVTALLSDPLSSNDKQADALNNRWSDSTGQKVDISYGTDSDTAPSSLKSTFAYLTQFSVPVEISELQPPSTSPSKPGAALSQVLENAAIFQADIPIIVCNPLTISLSTILSAQLPMKTIVVVTSSIPQNELDAIIQQQLSPSRASDIPFPNVISANPGRAVHAIRILQAEPKSLSAIQKYQDDFLGSQLSRVTHALKSKLTSKQPFTSVRKEMALYHINDALYWTSANVDQLRSALDKAFIDTSILKEKIEELQAKAECEVFRRCDHSTSEKLVLDTVGEAIKQAEKEMRPVMDRLNWWRMVWRVDEISDIVGAAITQTWCHDLEKKLILHTGRLSVVQNDISESALSLISSHRTVSTAVLRNSLLQIKTSPNYPLTPDNLTRPIFSRRNQLIEYPTMRLHVAGQRAVLGMMGGTLSGVGISWTGWMGWLLGSGEGLLGFLGMDAGTAIGVGMLSAVASIRWAVGKWERSKRCWWQDWTRVGEGLDRDLKVTLHETMGRQVVLVGETACEGMSQSIRAREEELAEVNADLREVQSGLDGIIHRVGEKS